jgi:hypothetical protein
MNEHELLHDELQHDDPHQVLVRRDELLLDEVHRVEQHHDLQHHDLLLVLLLREMVMAMVFLIRVMAVLLRPVDDEAAVLANLRMILMILINQKILLSR